MFGKSFKGDNDLSMFIPELYAAEGIKNLYANMKIAGNIYRDYELEFAESGDLIKITKPTALTAGVKADGSDKVATSITGSTITLPLDQFVYVAFDVADKDLALANQKLMEVYGAEAGKALAAYVDKLVLGQYPQFLDNQAGQLNTAITRTSVAALKKVMTENKVSESGRQLYLAPSAEADILDVSGFIEADKIGDKGEHMRLGMIGRIFGFDTFVCQNVASITNSAVKLISGEVNHGTGYVAGTTTMVVDGFAVNLGVGSYFTLEGDQTVYRITAETGSPTTGITFTPGLRADIEDNKNIYCVTPGAVNLSGGYAKGYHEGIVYDGSVGTPEVGQFVSFGTASYVYTIVKVAANTIYLERPLEAAIANDAAVNFGPAGTYNLAIVSDAIALVIRNMYPPEGVVSGIGFDMDGKFGMRVIKAYNHKSSKTEVSFDFLAGIKVLDTDKGALLLS